jgi:hypothetical protein
VSALPPCPLCGGPAVRTNFDPVFVACAAYTQGTSKCEFRQYSFTEETWRRLASPAKRRMAIPLTKGRVAWVDEEDYEALAVHRWSAGRVKSDGYYARRTVVENGKRRTIFMHRVILGEPQGFSDHVDGDGLNNTRRKRRSR